VRILRGQVCGGKLEVVLGGGSQTKLATYLIPPIIEPLAKLLGRTRARRYFAGCGEMF